jgi:hypothetical protein
MRFKYIVTFKVYQHTIMVGHGRPVWNHLLAMPIFKEGGHQVIKLNDFIQEFDNLCDM